MKKNQRNKRTILIADSCIGGLDILKHISKWSKGYKIVYLADYKMNPFGLRSKNEIKSIVVSWFTNLVDSRDVCLVVIACNTASIAAYDVLPQLGKRFNVPIVSMIEGFKNCITDNLKSIKNKSVGIMATKYTVESGVYQKIVKKYNPIRVVNIIGTNSEYCVASGRYLDKSSESLIKKDFLNYDHSVKLNTILLGCTCISHVTKKIHNIIGEDVVFLDPGEYVSKLAKQKLNIKKGSPNDDLNILDTSSSPAASILNIKRCSGNILGYIPNITGIGINR